MRIPSHLRTPAHLRGIEVSKGETFTPPPPPAVPALSAHQRLIFRAISRVIMQAHCVRAITMRHESEARREAIYFAARKYNLPDWAICKFFCCYLLDIEMACDICDRYFWNQDYENRRQRLQIRISSRIANTLRGQGQ